MNDHAGEMRMTAYTSEEKQNRKNETAYQVILFSSSGNMQTKWLSKVPEGIYFIGGDSQRDCLLSLEGQDGQWIGNGNKDVWILDADRRKVHSLIIENKTLYGVYKRDRKYLLYLEKTDESGYVFHNYMMREGTEIVIGRSQYCDIFYDNDVVSREHARLRYEKGTWYIESQKSANGIFVNDVRVEQCELCPMDRIYIWGLMIIVGYGYIAVNDQHEGVHISERLIYRMQSAQEDVHSESSVIDQEKDALFNRKPRNHIGLSDNKIKIEPPPPSMKNGGMPMLLRLGSSMAMGASSMFTGNAMMMVSSVMFPFLSQKYTEKERAEYETLRQEKYSEYLKKKDKEIQEEILYEQTMLNEQYPVFEKVLMLGREEKRLWERRNIDEDFLVLRLGTGNVPLKAVLDYPEKRFQLDEDELEDSMYKLAENPYVIKNTAIRTSLTEHFISGMLGEHSLIIKFAKMMIMQIALLHSYDEVKMAFLMNKEDLKALEFIRFLPHAWDNQKSVRFIASEQNEVYRLGRELKKEIEADLTKEKDLSEILKRRPYYIIFAFDKKLFDSMELLKGILQKEKNAGISIITAFPKLPKECTKVYSIKKNGTGRMLYLKETNKEPEQFQIETYNEKVADAVMNKIANLNLMTISQEFTLPKMVTFLEMFGAGKIEHLNVQGRWKESNPVQSLAAPIGVATDGTVFCLDLHEKYQGPHGLIAGMTGSGKSEFIITYILSMAVNYHPDEVAFVLIDYKGGGLAGAFDDPKRGIHLPHLVGTMTNLDGAAIQRSMMSIQSELKRRQRIFNEAKSIANEGTMDIYSYQKLRRKGVVKEAIPHLFIISDEFAELKAQKPEFMDQLISTARIGRSLGVHLILATQKPAGVVNDQILSNTKFRVCLRVQDKMDSMDMLKRPEAAELKETGRFYLQVGYNEFFAMGQSAWCGAPYEPQEEVIVQKDDTIQFIDMTGQSILTTRPVQKKMESEVTQIVALVKYLSEIAEREKIQPRLLWKEPLPDVISLEEMKKYEKNGEKDSIQYCVGMADDPENQKQMPYYMDLIHSQNWMIVGDHESGKTTLLQSMLLTLSEEYTPDDVNYYILDYSSRSLKLFEKLPHCGAVLLEEEESDLNRFFKLIEKQIDERKRLYAELEVSTFDACRSVKRIPLILVVIDNFVHLKNMSAGMDIYMNFEKYLKEGGVYGVRYILTANTTADFLSRTRQEITDSLALHLQDRFEYGDVLNCRCTYTPPEKKGRGLCREGESNYEYQAAIFRPELSAKERLPEMKKKTQCIREIYTGTQGAEKLPRISENESYEEFSAQFQTRRFPLGYSLLNMKPVALPLQQFSMLSLYFGNPNSVKPVMKNILYWAAKEEAQVILVKRKTDSVFGAQNGLLEQIGIREENVQVFRSTKEDCSELWQQMMEILKERNKEFQDYCEANGISANNQNIAKKMTDFMQKNTRPIITVIEKFSDFCENKDEGADTIYPSIFKALKFYNIYYLGGFYQEEEMYGEPITSAFNPEALIMLIGGKLDRQHLVNLPYEVQRKNEGNKYNQCLMKYRNEYYPLYIPCDALTDEQIDEEERSIFQ